LDYFQVHYINSWVPLAIQKVCLTSGILFAVLTALSALYFRAVEQQATVAAVPATIAPNAVEKAA
jgi:hypothetical protein